MINFTTENVWLNIDKPIGFSSAKVVAIVKRITGAKKVGHAGTLDPFASGVLPIAVNKATKTAEQLMAARKKYYFHIRFGEFRDSDDIEGVLTESSDYRPSTSQIISALTDFVGKIKQTPSRFSAIKINGARAYELARKNIEFAMKEREIEVFAVKLISNSAEFCAIEIECGKGTYVRSFARELCQKLGVCGYVSKLVRLEVGKFIYQNTISLDKLKNIIDHGSSLPDGSMLFSHDVLESQSNFTYAERIKRAII
jgi:tRNA pseudouridine55 synthase